MSVHQKGRGLSIHHAKNTSMAAIRSGTLNNAPLRTAFCVSSRNHRSTKFSQLELVGIKCSTKRPWRFSHFYGSHKTPEVQKWLKRHGRFVLHMAFQPLLYFRSFVGAVVVPHQMQFP